MDNKQYVLEIATVLNKAKTTLPAMDLADILNMFGRSTSYGTSYAGARGINTLIHATYDWLSSQGKSKKQKL